MNRNEPTLMAPLDYRQLAPRALLEPPPVSALPGAVSYLQVPFAEVVGWRALRLDLHVPVDEVQVHPVVVYVHGGSFLTGLPAMGPWAGLLGRGIAVASVGYRFAGEAAFPAPVEDVRAAVAWVHAAAARYGIDRDRIALWGSSAGGYLAALAAVTGTTTLDRPPRLLGAAESGAPRLAGVVTHYAVTTPTTLRDDAYDNSEAEIVALEAIMDAFFGGAGQMAVSDQLRDPAGIPPFLLMHGDVDRRVGLGQSRRLHDALSAAGVSSELVVVPGGDHGSPHFAAESAIDRVEQFLRQVWER